MAAQRIRILTPETAATEFIPKQNAGTPTVAAGSAAGTTPPAPALVAGGSNTRGVVTFGTGTGPAAGSQVVVTFNAAAAAAPGSVQLTSGNSATALLHPYVTGASATGFSIGFATAPAASQANTTYVVEYLVIA